MTYSTSMPGAAPGARADDVRDRAASSSSASRCEGPGSVHRPSGASSPPPRSRPRRPACARSKSVTRQPRLGELVAAVAQPMMPPPITDHGGAAITLGPARRGSLRGVAGRAAARIAADDGDARGRRPRSTSRTRSGVMPADREDRAGARRARRASSAASPCGGPYAPLGRRVVDRPEDDEVGALRLGRPRASASEWTEAPIRKPGRRDRAERGHRQRGVRALDAVGADGERHVGPVVDDEPRAVTPGGLAERPASDERGRGASRSFSRSCTARRPGGRGTPPPLAGGRAPAARSVTR